MKQKTNKKEREKDLFRSFFCGSCHQTKPCGRLDSENCCGCGWQNEEERNQEYASYEKTAFTIEKTKREHFWKLKEMWKWKKERQCSYCGKEAIGSDWWLAGELVCEECQKGHAENCFSVWQQWYKKKWGIELEQWLKDFNRLPVNASCARLWIENKQHLERCQCLTLETQKTYALFAYARKEREKKMKECQCETSKKVRVSSDNYAWCELCEAGIPAASKKRVIKNRNDPRFWGLEVEWKVLCASCLENRKGEMPSRKRKEFNRYVRVGRFE